MAWRALRLLPRGVAALPGPSPAGRSYAKKAVMKMKGKGTPAEAPKGPDVCKDPVLLTTHAMGVNIYKEGPEVALKPDSEYPEWLFQMYIGPPKKLNELDPETHKYWRTLRKINLKQRNRVGKIWAL
ncbi:39S ribosomal protein L54, mitochondrial [Varanus komodoensis]|nr:39S ribosomal protein L54, mitochondrial [Varanus komodoensis]